VDSGGRPGQKPGDVDATQLTFIDHQGMIVLLQLFERRSTAIVLRTDD
jgi:hypothetical protein